MAQELMTAPQVIESVFASLVYRANNPKRFKEEVVRLECGEIMLYEDVVSLAFGEKKNVFCMFTLGKSPGSRKGYSRDILVARVDGGQEWEGNRIETFAEMIRTKNFIFSGRRIPRNPEEKERGLLGAFKDGRIVYSGIFSLRPLCGSNTYDELEDKKSLWPSDTCTTIFRNIESTLTAFSVIGI